MVDFPPGRRGHPPCPEGRILCQRHCSNSASIPSGWHGGSPENGPSYAGTWDPWLVCGASLHLQSPCVQVCSFLKNNIYIYSSILYIYITVQIFYEVYLQFVSVCPREDQYGKLHAMWPELAVLGRSRIIHRFWLWKIPTFVNHQVVLSGY